MTESQAGRCGPVAWATAGTAFVAGDESGDLHVVTPSSAGALTAVIDGLGHGPEAARAARGASAALIAGVHAPLVELVAQCHVAIRQTRGVALSVAAFDVGASSMTWLGVGNVEGRLLRAAPRAVARDETLASRGGVVGYNLPRLHVAVLAVEPGDLLLFTTDGITAGFPARELIDEDLQQAAERILALHARGRDDALVLVARYLGASG